MPHQQVRQWLVPYFINPVRSAIYETYLQVWTSGQIIKQVGVTLPQKIQDMPVIAKVGNFGLFVLISVYFKESMDNYTCTKTYFNFISSQESVKVNI